MVGWAAGGVCDVQEQSRASAVLKGLIWETQQLNSSGSTINCGLYAAQLVRSNSTKRKV